MQTKQSQQLVIDQSKTGLLTLLTLRPDSVITVSDTILVERSLVLGSVLQNLPANPDIQAAEDQIRIQCADRAGNRRAAVSHRTRQCGLQLQP